MDQDKKLSAAELRRQAEERLQANATTLHPPRTNNETQRLVHELEVHQIELEMQNAELHQAREDVEASLYRYTDLYDFAPIGYLTIDRYGSVHAANLTAAGLLGVERSRLLGSRFGLFIAEESRKFFSEFLGEVFAGQVRKTCRAPLARGGNSPLFVQIEAISLLSGQECRVAVIDITEHQRAEQALRESEALYRSIGESIDYGVWVCAPDGRNTYASESFLKMVGITQEQCSNFGWGDVLHPDDAERTIAAWQECIRTGGTWDIEHRFRGADGQWHHVLARGVPVRSEQGEIISWAGINLDISRLKQAEQELHKSRERLDLALVSAKMGAFDWDIVKDKRIWSDGVHSLLGTTPETFTGTGEEFFRIIYPEDRDSVKASLDRAVETIGVYESEYRVIWPDGSIHHINARGKVHSDGAGQAVLMTGVCWDITERKRTEEVLRYLGQCGVRESGEEFFHDLARYLAKALNMDFVCIDLLEEGHLSARTLAVFHNGQFEDNVSYALKDTPCGDVVGKRICCFPRDVRGLFPKDDVLQELLAESYLGATLWSAEGKPIGLIAVIGRQPLADTRQAESILQLVAVRAASELERQLAEKELRYSRDAAETANRAKSQFLANMSHELRTPMTGVLGMLELALGHTKDEKQREFLWIARTSAHSLLRILNDILDLTKAEAGKLVINEDPFAFRECLESAVEIFIREAHRKGLDLVFFAADDLQQIVIGDQFRLRQVLTNLVGNAVKFTDRGSVEVRVTAGEKSADGRREFTFTITDTGIGIPGDKSHLLFRSFSQADDSHSRTYGGTGLGLAISKEIVELMGGTISFESTEGAGSVFTFTVPLGEAEETGIESSGMTDKVARVESTPLSTEEKGNHRILIAEDDSTNRKILDQVFRLQNFDPEFAANGVEAVEMWEQGGYDLIIMDVQMPKMDGFTATRAIRERERARGNGHTIIVAMTAHAFREDEQRCLDAGMDAYISKPIDFKQCFALITNLVRQREEFSAP